MLFRSSVELVADVDAEAGSPRIRQIRIRIVAAVRDLWGDAPILYGPVVRSESEPVSLILAVTNGGQDRPVVVTPFEISDPEDFDVVQQAQLTKQGKTNEVVIELRICRAFRAFNATVQTQLQVRLQRRRKRMS